MKTELVYQHDSNPGDHTLIHVFGVGGGGCNAVNRMIEQKVLGVNFIAANTDIQALELSRAGTKVVLGRKLTNGLGAGGNPNIGQQSAEEDVETIRELIQFSQMIFITAGMGGGTGTGAAPVIAQVARECGILSVGVVTLPFAFEGTSKMRTAEMGVEQLRQHVDTIITIPNQILLEIAPELPLMEAFIKADDVLRMGIQGIADIITQPGYINVDFNDVRTIMSNGGTALMGIGAAKGENRAEKAAVEALTNPLLRNCNIAGATGILVQITGDPQFSLVECETVMKKIREYIHSEDTSLIHGMHVDPDFEQGIRVTVIATGFTPLVPEETETDSSGTETKEAVKESLFEEDYQPEEAKQIRASINASIFENEEQLRKPAIWRRRLHRPEKT